MLGVKFFSWVPTVSGRLSYSYLGHSTYPRYCARLNQIGGSRAGQAVFLQERFCDDFVLPFFGKYDRIRDLVHRALGRLQFEGITTGQHFFIAIVDAVEDRDQPLDKLVGRIFPILATPIGKNIAAEIRSELLNVPWQPEDEFARTIKKFVNQMEHRVDGVCPVVVHFELRRDGITELWATKAKTVPGGTEPDDQIVAYYVEQSFFFLRDISHVHQHHDPATDTVIRVHRADSSFMNGIYFDLFRAIIRFKRVRSSENIMSASGILAYAKSFSTLKYGELKPVDDYQVDNLRMSLDAAQFSIQNKAQRTSNQISITLTAVFSFFGALLSLSAFSQFASETQRSKIVPSEFILYFTMWIAKSPVGAFALCAFISLSLLVLFGFLRPNRFFWFEDLQRLFHSWPRLLFVLCTLGFGLGAIWLSYSLFFWYF